jgi:hypothetical protein
MSRERVDWDGRRASGYWDLPAEASKVVGADKLSTTDVMTRETLNFQRLTFNAQRGDMSVESRTLSVLRFPD